MVVGRLLSYWEGNFSGAMLHFGGVIFKTTSLRGMCNPRSFLFHPLNLLFPVFFWTQVTWFFTRLESLCWLIQNAMVLLMAEILHQLIGSLSHYLRGFIFSHQQYQRVSTYHNMDIATQTNASMELISSLKFT